jgi:hypothetical protein
LKLIICCLLFGLLTAQRRKGIFFIDYFTNEKFEKVIMPCDIIILLADVNIIRLACPLRARVRRDSSGSN